VFRWNAGEQVTAVAYDNPIPGFDTRNCINLRLWAAKPGREFDLEAFNTGDYVQVGVLEGWIDGFTRAAATSTAVTQTGPDTWCVKGAECCFAGGGGSLMQRTLQHCHMH
jgi:hypothetical protein